MSSASPEVGPSQDIFTSKSVSEDQNSQSSRVMNAPEPKANRVDSHDEIDELKKEAEEQLASKGRGDFLFVSICCVMVAFGGFVFGWDTGTISGFVQQTDFKNRFGQINSSGERYLSNVRTGLMVSIFNIGCAIGGIVLGKVGEVYGRRLGLTIVVIIYAVGIVIQIASIDKWYQYFIGRIISGLGVGAITILSPMLISEVAPKHLRGTLVSCYQFMVTGGIFLGYCTNFGTKNYNNSVQWRVPLGLCFAWALFMIAGMSFVPESPRYLVEAGKLEEARRSLARANKAQLEDAVVTLELESIEANVEAEKMAGKAGWKELIVGKPQMLKRTLNGIVVMSLQQLTGDNYFFYYGTTIFKAVGLTDSFETSIVLGVVNFFSTSLSLYTVDRFGRRNCLIYGAMGMVACYVVYASVGVTRLYPEGADHPDVSSKGAGNVLIVFACFYIFCFATTWAPIAYVLISETYPLRVKGKAMSIASASNWMWGFLISFFTPFITSAINFYYGYVFMGCMIFAIFYVFFMVPETKGLTLEEVNEMYQEGVLPWRSTAWVPASRRGADYHAEDLQNDDQNLPFYKRYF
ncbi:LADA_0F12244g1_1 [Lachancea dasiensis]|uniref:LADA_0F12244g1_1 n=1 Tax=Lachancea dasiensis TaxID=1072105 RepID=A0A1G4JMM2_9SACH|nr:LADA_0F12244g1_1 [Lachancea dasiensis]